MKKPEIYTSDEGTCFSCEDACQAAWKELKELKERYRWIPVTERLPTQDGEYFIAWKDVGASIAEFAHGCFHDIDNCEVLDSVTHWREIDLPEVQP